MKKKKCKAFRIDQPLYHQPSKTHCIIIFVLWKMIVWWLYLMNLLSDSFGLFFSINTFSKLLWLRDNVKEDVEMHWGNYVNCIFKIHNLILALCSYVCTHSISIKSQNRGNRKRLPIFYTEILTWNVDLWSCFTSEKIWKSTSYVEKTCVLSDNFNFPL